MTKKVLYISYDGMTDPLGQSQVLPYISGLSKLGYSFHLISFEKPDRYEKHRKHISAICKSNNIVWHPQDYQLSGGLKKTIRQVKKMKKVSIFLHQKHQFDIIHCRSYISALTGLFLKRKYGVKFVFDMRGFWADERVDGKIWDLGNPIYKTIYKYFKRKEIQFFKESDYTISLTTNGKQEIESWKQLAQQPPRIKVIPCCVDLQLFDPANITPEDQQQLRTSLGIQPNNFVIGYVGSIGTWYMLSEMLDYFKVLLQEKAHAKFLFVTGESPEYILNAANKKGIDQQSIIITSTLHSGVPLHVSLFDYSIFFIRSSYSKKASSPTKQGEIMAMGVPLVCNAGVGDTDQIVEHYNCGKVVQTFDDSTYASAIIEPAEFDPEAIKHGAKDYFSLEEGIQRYLQVYQEIYD